ncbi:hypothetical protein D3C84_1135050 [compost metagenome]
MEVRFASRPAGLSTNTTPTSISSTTANRFMKCLAVVPRCSPTTVGTEAPLARTDSMPEK